MALKRFNINGHGQLELNNAAFRRDGRIEAQCDLDPTDFATIPAENGMFLEVDLVNRLVKLPDSGGLPLAINYSAEHTHDEEGRGLKDFKLAAGGLRPRLGYPAIGDKYTTNCVCYDDQEFNDDDALIAAFTSPVYGSVSNTGVVKLSATKPQSGMTFAVKKSSMPDGQVGFMLHVLAD